MTFSLCEIEFYTTYIKNEINILYISTNIALQRLGNFHGFNFFYGWHGGVLRTATP